MFALADTRSLTARRAVLAAAPHPHRMRAVASAAAAAASVFVVVLAGMLANPAAAHAEIPVIGPAVKTIETGAETLLDPVETALTKVLQAIFGGIEAKLITAVINGLLTIPNFDTGHVAQLEHTTVAIAAGMLSAVLTLSILRYYLAGLSDRGSGGFEAIQGLVRVVGAVGFIVAWSSVFAELVQIPKAFDGALLSSGTVQHSVALLFDAALVVGVTAFALNTGLGLIFVILIAFIAAVVFIALLWMKVLVSVMMMFLYVSMPLCVVMWPVPELSWLAVAALRSLFVALLVPCVWAILFALSAAINADVLTWAPSHSIIDTVIIRPLAGITLMLLCITIPRFLIRTAMIGPHGQANGGGRVWRTVTFGMFAMRGAGGVAKTVAIAATEGHPAAQRMIDALPSQVSPPSQPGQGSLAGRVAFGRSGFSKNGKEANKTGDTGEDQQDGRQDATIKRQMQLPGVTAARYDGARIDRAGEEMYNQAGASPSSAAAVSDAMSRLPAQTQRAIAQFHSNDQQKLRDLMAHNLHSPSLTQDQHQALWTIGTARNQQANEGIDTAIAALDGQQRTEHPSTAVASAPQAADHPGGGGEQAQSSGGNSSTGLLQPGGGDHQPAAAWSSSPTVTGASISPPPATAADGRSAPAPQQPAIPNDAPGTNESPLPDIEPFLD